MTPVQVCSSPEVLAFAFNRVGLVLLVGVLGAGFVGKLLAEISWHFLFLYIRRRPSWRRFDRAMSRLFA